MKSLAAVAGTVLLAACQAGGPGTDRVPAPIVDRPAPGAADAPRERPSDFVILGEATYRERIKTPPGARLDVELVDAASGAVLARTSVRDVAGPPMPFSLPYQPARVPAAGRYALRAMLVGPDGERWFATPAPVPVVPGEGTAVELLMHRAADAAAGGGLAAGPAALMHWECGDLGVMARRTGDAMELAANGARWRMQRGADGGFTDAGGSAFRTSGDTAQLSLRGEPARDCVPARQPSPWNAALASGIDFRAVGNEPGWFVEVDRDAAPALRATLDYGELQLLATRVESNASGFTAVDASGTAIELAVQRRPCTDGMSGQRFETTVSLQAGGRRYEGCGAYLAD
ncbi:YbaY family lipoprotein [Lysobacter humi (ex Lee et al. 2017)]